MDSVRCKSGTEYPERQDCVTIPQTSERVGDLALVEVSRRAAPILPRARRLPCAVLSSLGALRNEQVRPGPWMTTRTMVGSQKETRTRELGFRGCGGVLLLDRWGAQSTHVVRGLFRPTWKEHEAGRRWEVSCEREARVWIQPTQDARQVRRGAHNEAATATLLLPCSGVQPVNWPQVPRTRGTDGAAQLQCSAVAAARCSAGEHRTATVLDHRLRLYTEVSTLCCRVTRAIWGETFEKQGWRGA